MRKAQFLLYLTNSEIDYLHDQYVEMKIVWFQKFSIPPPLPQKGYLLRPPPPTSLEIPVKLHTFT